MNESWISSSSTCWFFVFKTDKKLRMMVHCFALCWSYFSDTPLLVINREVNGVFDKGEVLVPW